MSEIRERIVREAVQRAADQRMFPQMGTVLHYHDNAPLCLCAKHGGSKLRKEFRGTVDLYLNHGKRRKRYEHVGCAFEPSAIVDRNLKAGDRVIVSFLNGDPSAPIVTGVFRTVDGERTTGGRMAHYAPDAWNELEGSS